MAIYLCFLFLSINYHPLFIKCVGFSPKSLLPTYGIFIKTCFKRMKICFADPDRLHLHIQQHHTLSYTHSVFVHVCPALIAFLVTKKKKEREKGGLWLSLSIMWRQPPIGLACWRGIMPQGQWRHNVSLSGCHTGQWRRVSHRRPAHPRAAAPPPLLSGSGRDGVGPDRHDWTQSTETEFV